MLDKLSGHPNWKKLPGITGVNSFEGKHVKITGRIEMYKGKTEIRINAAEQLEVE